MEVSDCIYTYINTYILVCMVMLTLYERNRTLVDNCRFLAARSCKYDMQLAVPIVLGFWKSVSIKVVIKGVQNAEITPVP